MVDDQINNIRDFVRGELLCLEALDNGGLTLGGEPVSQPEVAKPGFEPFRVVYGALISGDQRY